MRMGADVRSAGGYFQSRRTGIGRGQNEKIGKQSGAPGAKREAVTCVSEQQSEQVTADVI